MADEEACTLAVRMATGDAYSDEEIRDQLIRPLRSEARALTSAAGGADAAAAIDRAAANLAAEEIKLAYIKAQTEMLKTTTDAVRRARIDMRIKGFAMSGYKSLVKVGQSFMIGTEHRAYGSAASSELKGKEYGNHMVTTYWQALDNHPGLLNRVASVIGLKTETGFTLKVMKHTAYLNGDTSEQPQGDPAVVHAAEAGKALLDTRAAEYEKRGAWLGRLPGYIGPFHWDPILVGNGFWKAQRAQWAWAKEQARAIADPAEREAALAKLNFHDVQLVADRQGFTPFRDRMLGLDRGGKPRLDPRTFESLSWSDWAAGEQPLDRTDGTRPMTDEDWDEAHREARARQEAKDLHAQGLFNSDNDPRELMLWRAYRRMSSARGELLGPESNFDAVPEGGNLAVRVSKGKVFHWASVEDQLQMRQWYSREPYFAGLVRTAERTGHDMALMEDYSPDIQHGFRDMQKQLYDAARSEGARKAIMGTPLTVPWEVLNGSANIPVSLRMAEIFKNIRSSEIATKLGSVVLSKPSDMSFYSQTMTRAGASFLQSMGWAADHLANLADPQRRAAARMWGAGLRQFKGRVVAPWVTDDARPGRMAYMAAQSQRFNGFSQFNTGFESLIVGGLQQLLGSNAEKGFYEIDNEVRQRLLQYEIEEPEWNIFRQAHAGLAEDGEKYWTHDAFDQLAKEQPDLASQIYRTKSLFAGFFHDQMRLGLNEPTARMEMAARAPFATMGLSGPILKKGEFWGEIAASLFQFKKFVGQAFGRHFIPAFSSMMRGDAGPMVQLLMTGALTGYLSMQMKAFSKGVIPRTPQQLIDEHPGMSTAEAWTKVWGAALAQGGGLGLYGDYLFGELDRNNKEFDATSFMGPAAGQATQVLQAFQHAITGNDLDPETGHRMLWGELARLTGSNIPVINTWYTRLAIDYLLLWRLQEAASPGYLARYQSKQQQQAGTRYWFAPTTPSPYAGAGIQ